jgi:tetratricopeptide (TPR) repeat protein
MPDAYPRGWLVVANDAVNRCITGGRYAEALLIGARVEPAIQSQQFPPHEGALVHINLAEAEYNLGRWEDAEHRLRDLDDRSAGAAITRAGLMLQRAWIFAHQGRGKEAWACAQRTAATDLPEDFRTERHYTRAAALIACGRLDQATAEIGRGLAIRRRPSSERNGWFMLARLAAIKGDLRDASGWCTRASAHSYKGQGGDGLLLWGEVLERLGRIDDARRAWTLVGERDPESECVAWAKEGLRATAARQRPSPSGSGDGRS